MKYERQKISSNDGNYADDVDGTIVADLNEDNMDQLRMGRWTKLHLLKV